MTVLIVVKRVKPRARRLAATGSGCFDSAGLAGELHGAFFPRVQQEHAAAVRWVLALNGNDWLLQHDQRLALSIRLRNPYIDPISVMQADLLKRWRDNDRQDDALLHALVASINGVSQGVQNTG